MANKKTRKKPGPKPIEINWEQVEKLAGLFCTQEEIASVIGCSVDTLARRKEFADIMKKGQAEGRASLRRWQFVKARDGNVTMLIWLGKQYLGQSDKVEQTVMDKNFDVEIV